MTCEIQTCAGARAKPWVLVLGSELSNNPSPLFSWKHYSCRESFQSSCFEIWEQRTRGLGLLVHRGRQRMRKPLCARAGAEREGNTPLVYAAGRGLTLGKGRNRLCRESAQHPAASQPPSPSQTSFRLPLIRKKSRQLFAGVKGGLGLPALPLLKTVLLEQEVSRG